MTHVPIPVAIGICLATVAGVWWAGTHRKDFMIPRGTGNFALADLSPGFEAKIAPAPRAVVPVDLSPGERGSAGAPGSAERPFLELGDFETSPGLSEYSEHASKGVDYLVRLATELEARGEFQRALLAWERVLDSCEAKADERTTASSAVARIRPTLPRWNIDPVAAIPLVLQIGSTRPESQELQTVASRIERFLEIDSGDQIEVVARVTANPSKQAPADGPIAIALSGPGDATAGPSLVRSTVPEANDAATLYRALLAEAYLIVASHLTTLPQCVPPKAPAYPDDPERDFHFQVTRLHWNSFARSLSPHEATDIPRAEIPEDDEERAESAQ
jgi:hypothetical protein